jgi:hypothetical protein
VGEQLTGTVSAEDRIQRLDLQRGDVLVVKSKRRLSGEQAYNIQCYTSGYLSRTLGYYVPVVVVDDEAELEVLRPTPPAQGSATTGAPA